MRSTTLRNRSGRPFLLLAALAFFILAAPFAAFAQFFPFYSEYESIRDESHKETWAPWPFYENTRTSTTLNVGVHPLFNYHNDTSTRNKDIDVLWPIFNYRYRPERVGSENYRRAFLFPIYYDRKETRFGREVSDRFLLPLWFEGSQGEGHRYKILFPFFWYAWNARVPLPLFPQREMTFGALFPLAGDFRGYFNRDRIAFFLWPLFVYSSDDKGDDYNEIFSFLWPIFGLYKGPEVSGFRIWPLFARVKKEDEFLRSYWLWPLGHYRKGRISKTNPEQEDVTLFIPFYADFNRPNIDFDMVFPFYGRLEVGDRVSQGYALAIYNVDINTRTGIREDRYLWFLIRRKTRLENFNPPSEEARQQGSVGGGVFPFYTRTHSPTRVNKSILWPFHTYRYSKYNEYTFTRSYIIPFMSTQLRVLNTGEEVWTRFYFPFFRQTKNLEDMKESNALHLFFYTSAAPMDRSYAPLWTFWEKEEDLETGAKTIRWFKNAWIYERKADGTKRKTMDLFFFDSESVQEPGEPKESHWRLLWGLIGRHQEPDLKTELFGLKF